MPRIAIPKTRQELRRRRHLRVRNVLSGTTERPRLVVFRSLKHITAQIVDDTRGHTLLTVTDMGFEGKKSEFSMMHEWPVRVPRPTTDKLASTEPFIVGQRVLDALSGGAAHDGHALGTSQRDDFLGFLAGRAV